MMALDTDVVARRKLLDDLDIRGEAGACEHALEHVVAQQRRIGHAACQRGLEGIDIVDALAGIRAVARQILIDIRYGRIVGIDPAQARKRALEQRTFPADRQRRRHPRLQDGIALHDPTAGIVEARPIERVCHLADQPADRVTRQLRVGIESDDVADIGGDVGGGAVDIDECRVPCPAQQSVQLVQLAAFTLPADPLPLSLVPDAATMQQEEARATLCAGIAPVEVGDAGGGCRQQGRIARGLLGRSVGPIGQEGEMKVAVGAGEVMNFQPLDLLGDRLGGGQQCRYGDHGPQVGRNPGAEFQGRQ